MKMLIYGLSDEELAAVRARAPDAEVERLTALPDRAPEGLLLVSTAKMDEFVPWAKEREEGNGIRPIPVLFYLPVGAQEPDGAWEYCDGVVSDNDWERLETLLECPRVLDAEVAAADVPTRFLRDLKGPVTKLRIADLRGDAEWDRDNSEMRQHLATCVTCRAAFNEALEWEWRQTKQLERLNMAEFVSLPIAAQMVFAQQIEQAQRRRVALAALLTALLGAQLRPTARARGAGQAVTVEEISDLLTHQSEGVLFMRPHRQFRLRLTDGQLKFGSLRGESPFALESFRVELRRGENVLWSEGSVEGKVTLPLTALEEALANGDFQLVILTQGEGG